MLIRRHVLVLCSEMSWLITRAWERGSKFAQDDQHAQALAFLAAALELMDFCDDFRDTKEVLDPIPVQLCRTLTYHVMMFALPSLMLL